jgi:hypothetical protein
MKEEIKRLRHELLHAQAQSKNLLSNDSALNTVLLESIQPSGSLGLEHLVDLSFDDNDEGTQYSHKINTSISIKIIEIEN